MMITVNGVIEDT